MKNKEIAAIFYEIADMLDITTDNFKQRAYRFAARVIEEMPEDLENVWKREELTRVQGIGKNIAKKIDEYFTTGKISLHERLKSEIPQGVLEMLAVPGMGPKKAGFLHRELGISSLDELERAARERRLRRLKGFGEKTEKNIIKGIEMLKQTKGRVLLGEALPLAERIIRELAPTVEKISVAGSIRRMKETIGDVDILAVSRNPRKVMELFSHLPFVTEIIVKGDTKTSVYLEGGLQADLRVVERGSFGAALQYFTGSKDHNIHLRTIAQKIGYKINEYGLFEGEKKIGGETEEEIYGALGMEYIEPELRENRGEIEAAQEGKLPELVRLDDVRGDLHIHTNWSDGSESIEGIARMAREYGYEYIAIADHTQSLAVTRGLSEDELELQLREIRRENERIEGFTLLAGTEVDIKENGDLDLDDSILKELDLVIAAVHSKFTMPAKKMTTRIVEAIRNEHVDVLAHPTGRLIGKREAYEIDFNKLFEEAVETKTALEINSYPNRLDLSGPLARMAKEAGAMIALGTDAHSADHFGLMMLGVGAARRGWLERKDILNCLSAKELLDYLM